MCGTEPIMVNTWIGKTFNLGLDNVTNVEGFGGSYGLPKVETMHPSTLIFSFSGTWRIRTRTRRSLSPR